MTSDDEAIKLARGIIADDDIGLASHMDLLNNLRRICDIAEKRGRWKAQLAAKDARIAELETALNAKLHKIR